MRNYSARCHPNPTEMRSYVTLYYNESSGEIEKVSSRNLEPYRNDILHEASEKIMKLFKTEVVSETPDDKPPPAMLTKSRIRSHIDQHEDPMDLEGSSQRFWQDKARLEYTHDLVPRHHQPRKPKSRSVGVGRARDIVPHTMTHYTSPTQRADQDDMTRERLVQFKISSQVEWEKWFYDAFRAVQQVGCRTMAKEWIKIIHPKKQSTNPYNGKNPNTRMIGDPDDIKPTYWPEDVKHKEPDHINREERCRLLLHLLMQSPHKVLPPNNSVSQNTKEIDAEALMTALDGKFDDPKYGLKHRRSIIEKIIFVRTQLEQYEDGGYTVDATLSVPDYASSRRINRNDDDGTGDTTDDTLDVITEHDDANDDYATTSASTSFGPQLADLELPERAQMTRIISGEHQTRSRTRKKPRRRETNNNTATPTQKMALAWDSSVLPVNYGLQTPQMTAYMNGMHHAMNDNGLDLADPVHPSSHPGVRNQAGDCFLSPWDAMGAPMDMTPQYNDPNRTNQRAASDMHMNANQFMDRGYQMMPQQQFVGQFPYPQQCHYMPNSGQSFDQSAYF